MRTGRGALAVTMVLLAFVAPALTSASFSSRQSSLDSNFTVGAFSPSSAPTPSAQLDGSVVRLRWPAVTFPGASTVIYRVRRTSTSGNSSEVCAGTSGPTIANGEASCIDSAPLIGVPSTYAVQPALVRGGVTTWNMAYGAESQSVTVPGLLFAGSGTVINTVTSGIVNVPYPAGTEIGDLLLLVAVNGRNRAPRRLVGWTDVVSRGIGGGQDFHLFAAQRIADGSGSVAVDVETGTEGASLQVLRYDVPNGNPPPILRASQVQSGFSSSATANLVPAPDIITTAAATAVSIVAVRAANTISLVAGSAWTLRSVATSSPGTVSLAWALADTATGAAATVVSPTWQQSGTPARWIFGGSAFG